MFPSHSLSEVRVILGGVRIRLRASGETLPAGRCSAAKEPLNEDQPGEGHASQSDPKGAK